MSAPEKQLHIDIPENDNLNVIVPASLRAALDVEAARTGEDTSAIIIAALAQYLGTPIHTLFQVSTSGALVAGVFSGMVSVKSVLEHGDFADGRRPRSHRQYVRDGHRNASQPRLFSTETNSAA
jgi:hypothetical protein